MFKFKVSDLPEILTRRSARYSVFVPSESPDNAQTRTWSRRTRKEVRFMEPDEYTSLIVVPKGFVFSEREELFRWEGNEKTCTTINTPSSSSLQEEGKILFGLRPRDMYGLAYMNRFFLGEHHDINYHLRRQHVFIVVVSCLEAGPECYCVSMGTGPFAETTAHTEYGMQVGKGYDPLLTSDYGPDRRKGGKGENDWYWVGAGSGRGKALLSHVASSPYRDLESMGRRCKKALQEDALKTFCRTLDTSTVRQVLAAHFKDEEWDVIASSCITYTGCTRVCPTCTCFTAEEEQNTPHSGTRVRAWDSCQSASFTRNMEFHNLRSKTSAVRYRIYDKLQYTEERFGMKDCTGCGRCAAVCPASIDMVDTIARVKEQTPHEVLEVPASVVNMHYEREECLFDLQSYTSFVAEIIDIFEEAKGTKRFTARYRDRPNRGHPALCGQLFVLIVFGVGEIATSVPFSGRVKDAFTLYIKKVGKVTTAIHNLKVGDMTGPRGPFGILLPYKTLKRRNLLVVGSGVGHTPVHATLVRVIENRPNFGRIVTMASASTYDGLPLKDDLREWARVPGVEAYYSLSKPMDQVDVHIGYINDLLPGFGLDWKNISVIICASACRIKAVARDLMRLGMKPSDTYMTLETNMHCGIGKYGHCRVGGHYMCVDGPVSTHEEMLQLPPEFQIH